MYAIGIDIGYGYTKGLAKEPANAARQAFFVSAVGPAEEINYQIFDSVQDRIELGKRHINGGMVMLDGHEYFYGNLALRQSLCLLQARDRSWIGSEPYRVLLHAVAERLIPPGCNGPVSIVTGLPVIYYPDRERLAGIVTAVMETKDLPCTVRVIPQPFGTFFDYILDPKGEVAHAEEALQRMGIIDIGYYTTDLVEVNKLEFIAKGSSTIELGVSAILDQIIQKIYNQYSRRLNLEEAEEALKTGSIKVHGRTEDVIRLVDKAVEMAAGALEAEAYRLWHEGSSLDRILLSGGGGTLFQKMLVRSFPGIVPITNPQWANVRGYLKYATRIAKRELLAQARS